MSAVPTTISTPVSARFFPQPSYVEAIQEVEYKQIPLQNLGPMRRKVGPPIMHTSRLPSDVIYIRWSITYDGGNMRFYRGGELNA